MVCVFFGALLALLLCPVLLVDYYFGVGLVFGFEFVILFRSCGLAYLVFFGILVFVLVVICGILRVCF